MMVPKYLSSNRKKTLFLNENIEHYKFGNGVSLSSQGDRDGRWSSGIEHSYIKCCYFSLDKNQMVLKNIYYIVIQERQQTYLRRLFKPMWSNVKLLETSIFSSPHNTLTYE